MTEEAEGLKHELAELRAEHTRLRRDIADYESALAAIASMMVRELGSVALRKAIQDAARREPNPDERDGDLLLKVAREHVRLIAVNLIHEPPKGQVRLQQLAQRASELFVLTILPGGDLHD